jgi:acyl-coenzyme A synthetase/AMP-(fatty) acid ligase/3-hydroxymyristoyl/3-hydroxydecanoyl-(acyl carrier protein) dehydratase
LSLARLLAGGRPPRTPVAVARGGARDFEDFRAHVAGLAGRLREQGRGRWLLHCEDAYAFAVALFGVAHAGAVAVLLPNRQPGALARAAHLAQGALLDAAEGEPRAALAPVPCVVDPLDRSAWAARPAPLEPLDLRAPLLELSTSGTTGEGKQVPKALRQLDAEVAVLEATFGPGLGPATQVFATASPQHLYGLLFRVLWPLASGRPFHAATYLHAEELLPRIEEAGDAILAGTPAHLSRLSGLARVRGACREVFSSGGPLDPETADAVRAALGRAPVEVFGSTETGGVAWRRQEPGPDRMRWTPLPGVRVSLAGEGEGAGRLRVASPFVSAASPEEAAGTAHFTLGDLVELGPDGRFLLLGRGDRVVKIGEKRLALPEMESQLRAHPFVSEAALLPLEQGGETRVGAALVLSEPGRAALEAEGRRAVSLRLAEDLAAHWDRVLLPRAWRYVDALPRDAQGKTPVALLRELFAPTRVPLLHAETRGPLSLARELSVPEDLAFLEGHFEGFPVVPGVAQLGWVVEAAGAALGAAPRIAAVENLKFKDVLLPGQRFRLELEWNEARELLRFRLAAGERVFSTGRLRLRAAEAP